MGQLDKAGVNTDEVLGAMKKSVATLAKEGISASDGLAMYYRKDQKRRDGRRGRQHRVGDLRHKGRLHDGRSNPRRLSGRRRPDG